MVNPWVAVPEGLSTIVTVGFWVLAIALVVVLYMDARRDPEADEVEIEGPAFTRFLFANSRAGLVWLPIRLFLGFEWLEAGWHKATGTGWLDGGAALKGFWTAAVAVPEQGRPPISYDWYRSFIETLLNNDAYTWFAPLIVFGEIAVGVGLLFGVLTGFAAFFGAFMNMSFLLAGSASTNPIMFTLAVGVILAWRVAGYYGVDRWLLPMLGTPWRRGAATRSAAAPMTT
jgi:thiosulfate dehydrogenase [quinone] large subunit